MTKLEIITGNYWIISQATRGGTPPCPTLTTEKALKLIVTADKLPPDKWRLIELMHVVRFNIIEGNTKWQNKTPEPQRNDSRLIPFTRN